MLIITEKMNSGLHNASRFRDAIISGGLRPPTMATLVITDGCNLQCGHCWPDSKPFGRVVPAPADRIADLIGQFAELETETLCITGGEPMTHPRWHEIVGHACRFSQFREVRLQTNATLIEKTHLSRLQDLRCDHLTVQVSLEAASEKLHDKIRGEGSFAKAVKGIETLIEAGMNNRIILAFTETSDNLEQLPDLLALADELQIHKVICGTLVADGRAGGASGLRLPEPCQYERLLEIYSKDSTFRDRCRRLADISAIEWFLGKNTPSEGICGLIEKPYVTARGTMYPCLMLQAPEYAVKDLFNRSLMDAIDEMIPAWSGLRLISRDRMEKLSECRDCVGREHCRGGCMGRAYASNRKLLSVEDRCALRRAVYQW